MVLVLGDCHFPYQHTKALGWAIDFAAKNQPKHIIQVGDIFDLFAFSKYPKVLKMSAEEELEKARAGAVAMWERLRKVSPKSKCIQLVGNHDERPYRRAIEKVPELTALIGPAMRDLFTFDGVETQHDGREEYMIDDVAYMHGYRSQIGAHMKYSNHSTVAGHSHVGGVVWLNRGEKPLFELNAGFLGDVKSPAFAYHSSKRFTTCTLGIGVVSDIAGAAVPMFIPYPGKM